MEKPAIDDDAPGPMFFSYSYYPALARLVSKARSALYSTAWVALLLVPLLSLLLEHSRVHSPKYTVDLAAFQGLTTTTTNNAAIIGRTVNSPAFNLTVHVDNTPSFAAFCLNRGEVVVSYSGVALAWGRVPGFCVQRRAAANLTVVAWGKGICLSDDLRGRLTSDWRRGTAKVLVEMKLYHYANYMCLPVIKARPGTSSISEEFLLGNTSEIQNNY
ncbi:hypothetical protein ACP70R_036896 [Stipagrostis hirtigluma subsp. patula]